MLDLGVKCIFYSFFLFVDYFGDKNVKIDEKSHISGNDQFRINTTLYESNEWQITFISITFFT